MINVIPENARRFTDFGWLKTYWLFSFAHYYDPSNIQFGALRVFNDDVVDPGSGFPTHPHEEMEIITIPISGEITHEDSMGNKTVIRAGQVQRMSAGTGLTHSEFNLGDAPVHFYQIWLFPDEPGLKPTYDQRTFERSDWHNQLRPLASGQKFADVVSFHTDATIYRSELDRGKSVDHQRCAHRRVFVYVTTGALDINGTPVGEKCQARIDEENHLKITAVEPSDFILIDAPSCKGYGYSEETLRGKSR